MKHIKSAATKAAHDTAAYMTADLRYRALEHGWDQDVVGHMGVHYEEGKFVTKVPGSHADRAFVHEYGDESHAPTAVIRRYGNSKQPEEAYLMNLHKHLGGLF